MKCHRCGRSADEELWAVGSEMLCDDCYISTIWPVVRKAYYSNSPAEFMHRLKKSYTILPQKYH